MTEGLDSQKLGAPEGSGPQEEQAPTAGYSLRALLRSSVLYLSGDLGLKLISFFMVPIYTRTLTPDDYGIIGFASSLINVLSPIVGLGLISSLPVLYYSYHGEERSRLISSTVNFTFLYSLAITIIIQSAQLIPQVDQRYAPHCQDHGVDQQDTANSQTDFLLALLLDGLLQPSQ